MCVEPLSTHAWPVPSLPPHLHAQGSKCDRGKCVLACMYMVLAERWLPDRTLPDSSEVAIPVSTEEVLGQEDAEEPHVYENKLWPACHVE